MSAEDSLAEARAAALLTYEGHLYTITMIAGGFYATEAELWFVRPGDDLGPPAWEYFGRRSAQIAAEARDQVEREFKVWVEGQLRGGGRDRDGVQGLAD